MAPSRALRPVARIWETCCTKAPVSRRHLSTSSGLRFEDIRTDSRLPRVATPSFWSSLIPKPLRRPTDPVEAAEREQARAAKPKGWNPYTSFIILALIVGSNAIQIISLRREMLNFSRKTEAKLELLREVVRKVRNGEEVDVRRALGTGDPVAEKEWEEVMKEVESTDMLWESKKKRDAKKALQAEKQKARQEQTMTPEQREGPGAVTVQDAANAAETGRPKFLM